MNELIKISTAPIGATTIPAVNARDLHAFLGVAKDFSTWVKAQLVRARLVEGRDFASSPVRGISGQTLIEYFLTLDAGKHVAMLSETDRGFAVRDYFLECERRALAAPAAALPDFTNPAAAARAWADEVEAKQALQLELAAAAPSVEFVERYADATGTKGFRQVAKLLKVKENAFREFLIDKKIMYRLGAELTPAAPHIDAGRFVVKAGQSEGGHAYNAARFTTKGITWIAGELAKHQVAMQHH